MPADWTPVKRCQKDLDAPWTKKHGNSYHGYKISINVDKRYKIIRNVVTDTASTHDSHHFDAVLDAGNNTSRDVYADKGYTSKTREEQLKKAWLRNHIQRKGARNHSLSAYQKRRNHRIAKTCAQVEHIFAALAQMGGTLISTIGQQRASTALLMRAACYNMKRLVYLQQAHIESF